MARVEPVAPVEQVAPAEPVAPVEPAMPSANPWIDDGAVGDPPTDAPASLASPDPTPVPDQAPAPVSAPEPSPAPSPTPDPQLDPWLEDSWGDDPWTEEPETPGPVSALIPAGGGHDDPRGHADAPGSDPASSASSGPAPSSASRSAREPSPRTPGDRRFRPELQGLRALAILMVVVYHVWFDRVSGGVDIFLLISAFFLTGTFMRRIGSGARLEVPRYWLRSFSRLVPPAAIVILATTLAGLAILPPSRVRPLLTDAVGSALYAQNWVLGARSVDYYDADHAAASPLQHFWSLAIQGQMFLLMPLLFAGIALLARRTGRRPARIAAAVLGALAATSLAYATWRLGVDQAFTYFDTGARVWEFCLGALLALALPRLERERDRSRPSPLRAAASWAGIALILACGWVVDVAGVFPGPVALWPLGAACLIIAAGRSGTRWGGDRLLSSAPLQWIGGISYALYLVHWPLLVLALQLRGVNAAGGLLGAGIIALSILLAWALTRLVDAPLRRSAWVAQRGWRGAMAILAGWALVLAPVGIARMVIDAQAQQAAIPRASTSADPVDPHPGARILLPGAAAPASDGGYGASPIPALTDVRSDTVGWSGDCPESILGQVGDIREYCTVVPTGAAADAPLIVLAGNSHALQAQPMVQELARENGWRLISVARPQCSFGEATGSPWCAAYNADVVTLLRANGAGGLITYSTYAGAPGQTAEQAADGFEALVVPVLDSGIPVLGLRDVPRLDEDFVTCTEDGGPCVSAVADSLAPEDLAAQLAAAVNARPAPAPGSAALHSADLTPSICPDGVCGPVVGNVRTYLDDNHLTATYSRTLGPALREAVADSGFAPGSAAPVPLPAPASDGGGEQPASDGGA